MNIISGKTFGFFGLFKRTFSQYKWQIASMAILSFLSGILEGVGINTIIPLFSFVDSSQAKATDIVSTTVEKSFLYFNLSYTMKSLLIFIVLLFIVKAVSLFITQYTAVKITADYEKKTRSELLELTLRTNWPYLCKQKVGYLDQILTTDVDRGSSLLFQIGCIILITANLIVYGLIAINISFTIAVFALVLGAAIFLIFKPLFYKTRIFSEELTQKYKQLAHYVNENIIGMKTIKSMFVEKQVFEKGLEYFDHMKNLRVKVVSLQNFTNAILQPIGIFFIIGIFALFYKTTAFNFVSFAVIVYAINKVFANTQAFQVQVHIISSLVPHLMSILRYKNEMAKYQEKDIGTKKFHLYNRLELRNVGFAYNAHDKVLSGINFSIKNGEVTGLIGPSGAGKTTIVDLLLRLFEPQKGDILLDGEDASSISLYEWRTNIGYVSQDIFLINDTIENNIKFYEESIGYEDIVTVTKMANIYDFIESLPDKFQTIVGERGIQLSVGQRQRIVLARVLARKPQLLILDEATSALDNESEVLIQKAIENLRGKITVFAIAHRLSTIMSSDHLVVLEGGKIIEEGKPLELLKNKNSYFFRVYNARE